MAKWRSQVIKAGELVKGSKHPDYRHPVRLAIRNFAGPFVQRSVNGCGRNGLHQTSTSPS